MKSLASQLSLKFVHHQAVTEEDLKRVGSALWSGLEIEEELQKACEQTGSRILPLLISTEDFSLLTLPWECLYHPQHGFLGKSPEFTLSREWAGRKKEMLSPPRGPLKVLLFTSLPDDVDAEKSRLDIETEQANFLESFDPWLKEGKVHLTVPDDGRFSYFQELLRGEKDFHLVYLSGHGVFQKNELNENPPQSFFLFEKEDGSSDFVEARQIAKAFKGSSTRCVVLSACQTGKASSEEVQAGLTNQIGQSGIPFVVGMRESITDRAGLQFARSFCDALVEKKPLDLVVQEAREKVTHVFSSDDVFRDDYRFNQGEEVTLGQWCLPLFYAQDIESSLIDWDFVAQPPPFKIRLKDNFAGIPKPEQFIGRRKEMRELTQKILGKKQRQIFIKAPGGQGKTTLAIQLAQKMEKRGGSIASSN